MRKTRVYTHRLVEHPDFPKGRTLAILGRVLRTMIFAFAQLRARMLKNDARRLQRRPEIMKILKSGDQKIEVSPQVWNSIFKSNDLPVKLILIPGVH